MPKYLHPFKRGGSQIGICQRSGAKFYRSDLVEDGQVKGELVHPDWYEPYHPLLLPPPMRPDGLPKRRPAPDDTFPLTPGVLSAMRTGATTDLTWTAFESTGSQLESYNVWRSVDNGVSFQLLGSVEVTQDIELIYRRVQGDWQQTFVYDQPFVDSESAAGYQYYVQGIQIHGMSANSNTVTV